MSTIYYGDSPLLFESEQAFLDYINQKDMTQSGMLIINSSETKRTTNTFPFYRILLIGGCIIIVIIIFKELSRLRNNNKQEMDKRLG